MESKLLNIADSRLRLVQVDPVALSGIWNRVRLGLERVIAKTNAKWLPEDVYSALKAQSAVLYVAFVGNMYQGFAVVVPQDDPFEGPAMFVWAAFTLNRVTTDLAREKLESIAKAAKFKRIVFHSPRRAWLRRLDRTGYRLKHFVFEKEL